MSAVDLVIARPDMQRAVNLIPVLCQGKEIRTSELVESRLRLGAEQCVGFAGTGLSERKAYNRTPAPTVC